MGESLSRRRFLKVSAAAAGAIGVAGAAGMTSTAGWLSPLEAHAAESEDEKVINTFHQTHCRGNCTISCKVRDGRICQIWPNEAAGEGFHKVCVKGLSEVQHVYSIERLQTPLKRVGERGSGEFEAITWDEAMDMFVENIHKVWDEHGKKSVFFWAPTENSGDVKQLPKLLGATVSGVNGIDIGYSNGTAELYATEPSSGNGVSSKGVLDVRDLVNTKTHIVVGSNFVESGLSHCSHYFDALDAGMYSYNVDPIFTASAGKASEWVPVEPGTDPAFFLGLIACMLEEGLYDSDFIKEHTTFPFLVSQSNGALLRAHVAETDDVQTAEENPYMVIDAANGVVESPAATDPLLEGTITVEGVEYATVFTLLKENAEKFNVEWAADTTGIPAEKIREIARRVATQGPARIDVGFGGGDRFQNSDIAGHAAGIVLSLTGNFSKYGSGLGLIYNGSFDQSSLLGSWSLPEDMKSTKYKKTMFELPYQDDIKAMIAWGDLQQRFAALDDVWDWLKTLDFVVYADIYNMSTAPYADLILPICTRFECEEQYGAVKTTRWHLSLREKCIDPLFESKSDFEAERTIAKALGFEDIMPKTAQELIEKQLSKATDDKIKGYTLQDLIDHDNVLPYTNFSKKQKPKFSNYEYGGPDNRLNVYYSTLIGDGQALPVWEPPYEQREDNPAYPLRFLQVKSRSRLHNQLCDSTWIKQFTRTVLEMNRADMQSRGLTDEDEVRVFNDWGSFGCPVVGMETVPRGTVKILQGEWTKYMTFGNLQNVTNPSITERGYSLPNGPVILFNDVLVEVEKA